MTITDPALVKDDVLSNKFGHLEKPQFPALSKLLADGLAGHDGEKWAGQALEDPQPCVPSREAQGTKLIGVFAQLLPLPTMILLLFFYDASETIYLNRICY